MPGGRTSRVWRNGGTCNFLNPGRQARESPAGFIVQQLNPEIPDSAANAGLLKDSQGNSYPLGRVGNRVAPDRTYSCRSASIGFSRAARRAGV